MLNKILIKWNLMAEFSPYWDEQMSVNYVPTSQINVCGQRKSCGEGGGDDVPLVLFASIINGLIDLKLSLTCRQGAIAEDLSEREGGRKRQRRVDKTDAAIHGMPTKQTFGHRVRYALAVRRASPPKRDEYARRSIFDFHQRRSLSRTDAGNAEGVAWRGGGGGVSS